MNLTKKKQHILPDTKRICYIIPALFSTDECESLLNDNVKASFEKAILNYPSYYRNNERYVTDNETLAKKLFSKVKSYLPETIQIKDSVASENGTWHLKELNNRIRFCKYVKNQYFHRHLDGVHYRSETTQSKLTFMIYLNDATEFKGGRTLFYKTKSTTDIWASYVPKKGDLIVFDHNVWHEGEILTEGKKFVLRSDILYAKDVSTKLKIPFSGHLGYIWSLLKFDQQTIISGGRDKEVKIWNIAGELKMSLKAHQSSILCIEKLNDATFITGSRDQEIIIWKNFKIYKRLKIHEAVVLSLCSLTATTFASSSGDGTIKFFTIEGSVLKTFQAHENWVWKIIKLSETHLASCSEDHSIKIWNIENEEITHSFQENCGIISLVFNSETKQLISGNLQGEFTIRTFDSNFNLLETTHIKAHSEIIRTIKFIDSSHFATGAEDNTVKVWNTAGNLVKVFEHQNFVQDIELIDTKTILSASYDGSIKTWEL